MRRIPGRTRALRAAAALLVSLLCAAPLTAARAAGEVALTVDTAQAAAAGEQVALSVHAADALTVDSLQFRINYDAAALRLVDEPAVGEALAGGIAISNTETAGVVGFAFACADGLSADGTLVTLTFEVLGETGSAVVLTDVLATTVDAARVQHKAYVTLQNGGRGRGRGRAGARRDALAGGDARADARPHPGADRHAHPVAHPGARAAARAGGSPAGRLPAAAARGAAHRRAHGAAHHARRAPHARQEAEKAPHAGKGPPRRSGRP